MLSREGLETRNHTDNQPTFYDAMVEVFNDENWRIYSSAYPELHSDFRDQRLLEKGEYTLTVDKCKGLLGEAKPLLHDMVERYELSGQGAMSRYDENADWGQFDITKCNGIDDRSAFLRNNNATYLLYWWNKMLEEDILEFSCVHLPKHFTATSDLAHQTTRPNNIVKNPKPATHQQQLNKTIALVGASLNNMARTENFARMDRLREQRTEYEFRMEDFKDEGKERKADICKKKIEAIDLSIRDLEKELGLKKTVVNDNNNN